MVNYKSKTLSILILSSFLMFSAGAVDYPRLDNLEVDSETVETGEEVEVTVDAEFDTTVNTRIVLDFGSTSEAPDSWDSRDDKKDCSSLDCSKSWTLEFDDSGEKSFEASAISGIDDSDSQTSTINVETSEEESNLDITLDSPDGDTSETQPDYEWEVSDDVYEEMDSVELVVDDDDDPFSGPLHSETFDDSDSEADANEDIEFEPPSDWELDRDEEYTWGIEAENDDGDEASDKQDFNIEESEDDEEDGGGDSPIAYPEITDVDIDPETAETGEEVEVTVDAEFDTTDNPRITLDFGTVSNAPEDWDSRDDKKDCSSLDCTKSWEVEFDSSGDKDFDVIAASKVDDEDTESHTIDITEDDDEDDEDDDEDDEDDGDDEDEDEGSDLDAEFDYEPNNPKVDQNIDFDASDSDGEIETYTWTLGDGTEKTGEEIDHTYSATGTYNVELEIENSDGDTDTTDEDIEVAREDLEQRIDSLTLTDLPVTHPTGDELTVTGEATGKNIDRLELYQKDKDSILWREIREEDCELQDTCTVSEGFTAEDEGDIDFKIEAYAGDDDQQFSETVRFYDTGDEDDDDGDDEDGDEDDGEAERGNLQVNVEDEDGRDLENVEVRAENSITKTRFTESDGEVYMDLEEGEYTVRASKTGYRSEITEVDIEEDETTYEDITLYEPDIEDPPTPEEEISITNIAHKNNVCTGEYLSIEVSVLNSYDTRSETVEITAQGIGENPSKFVVVNPGEERTKEITVTNLDETGTYNFNIVAENGGRISETRTVTVEDCTTQVSNQATGLTLDINPREINAGQTVTASGYLDGLRGERGEITIKADGETVARTNNDRDGYYQTYFKVHEPGEKTITAESQGLSQRRTLTVHPTVHIGSIDMPDTVVEGDKFEICGQVQSQSETRVVLESGDGEVLEAKDGLGETCFETTARETGEQEYQVRAFSSGSGSSARSTVRVIDTGPEAEKFPDVVATETSESGEFKVELYNKEEETKVYDIDVGGLDRNWISQSSREVHLTQGERETVYFYLTPRVGGTYHPEVNITVDDEIVLEDDVMVETRGNPRQTRKTWFYRIKSLLEF